MAVIGVVEVKAVKLVDDSTHLEAGFHIVVRSIENFAHEFSALRCLSGLEFLEDGKETIGGMIDEDKQVIAGDAFGVGSPVAPLEFLRDD